MRRLRDEIISGLVLFAGWALLTWGVASLLVWQVWPISGGLLLISVFGWKMLYIVAREGLYALTRGVPDA